MSEIGETPQEVVEQTKDPAASLRETIAGLKDKESAETVTSNENPLRAIAERLGDRLSTRAQQNLIDAQARAHGALAEEVARRELANIIDGGDLPSRPDEVAHDLFSPHIRQEAGSGMRETTLVTHERKGVYVPEVAAAISQSTDFREVSAVMRSLGILNGVEIPNPFVLENRMTMSPGDASLPVSREDLGIETGDLHDRLDGLKEQLAQSHQAVDEASAKLVAVDPNAPNFEELKATSQQEVSNRRTLEYDIQQEERRLNRNLESGSIELPTDEDGFVAEFIIQRGSPRGEFATIPPQYILLIKAKPEAAARIALTDEPPVPPASEVSAGEEQKAA